MLTSFNPILNNQKKTHDKKLQRKGFISYNSNGVLTLFPTTEECQETFAHSVIPNPITHTINKQKKSRVSAANETFNPISRNSD